MKIALVVHDYHKAGGHSRYVAELAERFTREHEVHVFANRVAEDPAPGIQFHHVPAWRLGALTTIVTYVLPATLKLAGDFDIIHAQGLCSWRQDVITAHICQGGWFAALAEHQGGLSWRQRLARALLTRGERLIYQPSRSPHVIAVSEKVRQDLAQHYGRTQDVSVIYHGVDLERFHPQRRVRYREPVRAQLGITPSDFVAIYVGDLQKGASLAMEAIAGIEGARLLLVSRSPIDAYHRLAVALGIRDRVIFHPPTEQIERLYAAADVLLFPTFYDAFGMVITEAMAMGLPVITTRSAGAAELIQSECQGIVVGSASDRPQLRWAVRRLMAEPRLREQWGFNARRKVEAYTWDRVAEETMNVYRRVLDQKQRRQVPRPVVAFLVNGASTSALGVRARAFATRLDDEFEIRLLYRSEHKLRSLLRFMVALWRIRPRLSHVFDMGYSGVVAAVLYKLLSGNRLIVDTGDVIYELAKSMGTRSRLGLWLTKLLETLSLRAADHLVVRGTHHRQWLNAQGIRRVDVIYDGVDLDEFKPMDATALRRQYRLDDVLTVGLVGTCLWNERWDMGYGWELVELLRLLNHAPVKGVLIGDGSGLPRLRARCREYGIEDKLVFLGHVPHDHLPQYLNAIDVCLSTQTNDLVGQVRTTGKLPLYLATGRYVLASRVGEAALLLDEEMLVEYEGVKDLQYPQRLAQRVQQILDDRSKLAKGRANRCLAERLFDYDVLAEKLKSVMSRLCPIPSSTPSNDDGSEPIRAMES